MKPSGIVDSFITRRWTIDIVSLRRLGHKDIFEYVESLLPSKPALYDYVVISNKYHLYDNPRRHYQTIEIELRK